MNETNWPNYIHPMLHLLLRAGVVQLAQRPDDPWFRLSDKKGELPDAVRCLAELEVAELQEDLDGFRFKPTSLGIRMLAYSNRIGLGALPVNYDLYVLFQSFAAAFECELADAQESDEETRAILFRQWRRLDRQVKELEWMSPLKEAA